MSQPVYTFTFIILLVNFLNANAKSPQSDFSTSQTISENKTSEPRFTNKVAPSDSYSMYKHLMEVKENMVEEAKEREPKVVKTVKMALQKLFEAALHGLVKGFLLERGNSAQLTQELVWCCQDCSD